VKDCLELPSMVGLWEEGRTLADKFLRIRETIAASNEDAFGA